MLLNYRFATLVDALWFSVKAIEFDARHQDHVDKSDVHGLYGTITQFPVKHFDLKIIISVVYKILIFQQSRW